MAFRWSRELVTGWIAVLASTLISVFWAVWGAFENFHEGWYHQSLTSNLLMMLGQYLSPMLIFISVGVVAVRWPRVGSFIHLFAAGMVTWYFGFQMRTALMFLASPLFLIGALYWFGVPRPRKLALGLVAGLPLVVWLACSIQPAIRTWSRLNDGDLGPRLISGNAVRLVWAPAGPGWPNDGVSWHEAAAQCRRLSPDGKSLSEGDVEVWRLPSADEAVRSSVRGGQNAGGVWDSRIGAATYRVRPDKETPLWNPNSKVIYWWTATELDQERAYRIVYNGLVNPLPKRIRAGYLAFRCVKVPDQSGLRPASNGY